LAFLNGSADLDGFGQDLGSLLGVIVKTARCEVVPELLDAGEAVHICCGHDGSCAAFDEPPPGPGNVTAAMGEQDHLSLFDFAGRVAVNDQTGHCLFR